MGAVAAGVAKELAKGESQRAGSAILSKASTLLKNGKSINSLADLARPAQVQPLVIVDKPLQDQPFMSDVMKGTMSLFIAYWMQGAAMMGTNIGRIDTLRLLDALNPSRDTNVGNAKDLIWSKENYQEGLPSLESFSQEMERNLIVDVRVSQEANEKEATGPTHAINVKDDDVGKFYEIGNLSIGKLVNVELSDGEHSGKVPVLFRAVPSAVPSKALVHIFTATSKNESFKERYYLWRAGQLTFVRDLMFNVDRIDAHRKALVNDTSNVYMTMNDRRSNNSAKALLSGQPSLADASNIAIISKATARDIGREMYGKIESSRVRKAIFDATYLLMLVVVDEEWERVTIYHRGLDIPTDVKFSDLKQAEKNKGPDITEFLKAFAVGSTPSF
jgi:hypothetical protein